MCMLTNLVTIIMIYFTSELFRKDKRTAFNVFMMTYSNAVQNFFFSLSHTMIAFKYYRIARNVPYKLKEEEPPEETVREKVSQWTLIAFCYIGPALMGPAAYSFRYTQLIEGKTPSEK